MLYVECIVCCVFIPNIIANN
uniref:Uncharacterized protein n=1 Tax=Arundo donax TaxID=35708 RepID=A0A0A8YEX8_ARUDO